MKYFSNFPIINYANNTVRDVFTRVKFDKKIAQYSQQFYPYQLEEGDRADVIAYGYYDDSYSDWMVYFSNQVIDPYYDYYLDQGKFNAFIESKYGSISNAQSQVYGYRNNWSSDDTVLTISGYDALSSNLKKFWNPVVGYSGSITGYERAKQDTYLTTNKIDSLSISLVSDSTFSVGEKVTQYNGVTPVANAYVAFSNSTVIMVKHIDGGFSNNASYTIKGDESSANATVSAVKTIKQNYANNEGIYYSSYSYYDYENEINEQKRTINLIDNRYTASIERQFKQLMGS